MSFRKATKAINEGSETRLRVTLHPFPLGLLCSHCAVCYPIQNICTCSLTYGCSYAPGSLRVPQAATLSLQGTRVDLVIPSHVVEEEGVGWASG